MSDLIQPRTLKGFRDYLPELMIPREALLEKARSSPTAPTASLPSIRRLWSMPRCSWAKAAKNQIDSSTIPRSWRP